MKSTRKKTILSQVSGGLKANLKDWRVTLFVALAFFASAMNLIQICIIERYSQLSVPIIWFLLGVLVLFKGNEVFEFLFFLFGIAIIVPYRPYSYRSLSIFILMILITTNSVRMKIIYNVVIVLIALISNAMQGNTVLNAFEAIIQIVFAVFCYYGFIFTSSKAFGHKSKLVYTEKEYKILYALATQDKTQKEIAYDLGLSSADMGRTLASVKKKNNYETSEALLRQFAIELYLTQKEH